MLTKNKIPFIDENKLMVNALKIMTKKKTRNFNCKK